MRLNQMDKKSRGWKKAGADEKNPKFISPEVCIGRISSDILLTNYAPVFKDLARESLEQYADDMMVYEEKLKEAAATSSSDADEELEVQIEADGTLHSLNESKEPPPLPPKPLFHSQFMIDEFINTVGDVSNHFSDKGGWKIHVNAAKFERNLDEKYGVFRPFITNHPEVEVFIRSIQRKYAMGYFSPFRRGSPPIPKSTSIIMLFMMQRNGVRWDAMILAAVFLLIGLQPWALVVIVAAFQQLVNRRVKKPIGTMSSSIAPVEPYWTVDSSDSNNEVTKASEKKRKHEILLKEVGKPFAENEKINGKEYDTVLIGSGPSTLYTGALLAKAGRKPLVLAPGTDASGCVTLGDSGGKYGSIPFDIGCNSISRITRQQELLTPALCTSTDYQGGIRFAQIGSEADGYAFEILSIPGMGTDNFEKQVPFVLRAAGGSAGIMEDTASLLGDGWPSSDGSVGGSTAGVYMAACAQINASAGAFYLSKVLPEGSKGFQKDSNYHESACRYAASFLNKLFPLNPHLRSLMAGIGMKCENITPSNTSMGAHISNICAATQGEGMFYPVGGPRSLCHALASVIEQNGGHIVTNVHVKELLFEKKEPSNNNETTTNANSNELEPPRCVGLKLTDGQDIVLPSVESKKANDEPESVVINMRGFIDTFVRLLPEDIRTAYKVPMGLPALSERRPLFKVLFAIRGSADDLSVTGADYFRLPGAALARDQVDPATGAIQLGDIGWSDEAPKEHGEQNENSDGVGVDSVNQEEEATEESSDPSGQGGVRGKRTKAAGSTKVASRVKFDAGISWMQVSFPSAKDPSWEERHGKVTTCVVTIEADDDFVVRYDTKPRLFAIVPSKVNDTGNRTRLMERVRRDLLDLYPQLDGKVEKETLTGPYAQGLSHSPERYAAKGIRPDTPYPGLFVGGSDLTVGGSFSGEIVGSWLVANAVQGYGTLDLLFLEKNITSDLERFLEPPIPHAEPDSDVAVPFKPKENADTSLPFEDQNTIDESGEE